MRGQMSRDKIISEAYKFMTKKGYSSFSYADLAKKIGITKPSIHYYFQSKSDLGEEVIRRSLANLKLKLKDIEINNESLRSRLNSYLCLFMDDFYCSRLPLCCSLSADRDNLPDGMVLLMADYFKVHLDWVIKIINQGKQKQETIQHIDVEKISLLIINSLEGANIVANALQQPRFFKDSFGELIDLFIKDKFSDCGK